MSSDDEGSSSKSEPDGSLSLSDAEVDDLVRSLSAQNLDHWPILQGLLCRLQQEQKERPPPDQGSRTSSHASTVVGGQSLSNESESRVLGTLEKSPAMKVRRYLLSGTTLYPCISAFSRLQDVTPNSVFDFSSLCFKPSSPRPALLKLAARTSSSPQEGRDPHFPPSQPSMQFTFALGSANPRAVARLSANLKKESIEKNGKRIRRRQVGTKSERTRNEKMIRLDEDNIA
ncbi:hypothetical protein C8Q80DRAFT_175796 [Daedaleopsis nitida]|nr:hypothetical protein C8Q80DRAFT_175796 [Daedaleopsis nitida]